MSIIPTPVETDADDDVSLPSMTIGSAHALEMTDAEKAKIAKRQRLAFGFGKPHAPKRGKGAT